MNPLNHWRLVQLRAAIISDLSGLIPENHYSSVTPMEKAVTHREKVELSLADKALWVIVCQNQNNSPTKVTPRQVAAGDVLKWIALYEATMITIAELIPWKFSHDSIPENFKASYAHSVDNLNYVLESLIDFSYQLLEDVDNWLLFLSEDEAKPYLRKNLKWPDDEVGEQIQLFFDKFGFVPECFQNPSRETRELFPQNAIHDVLQNISKHSNNSQLDNNKNECVLEENREQEICNLFDAIKKEGIIKIFTLVSKNDWERKYFCRVKRYGLDKIRENKLYNPAKIGKWLIEKGLYSQEQVDRVLANNLPERSKDKKSLIIGEY